MNDPPELTKGTSNRAVRRSVGLVVLAALTGVAIFYIRRHAAELAEQIELNLRLLPLLIITEVTLVFIRGLLLRELCRLFRVSLGVVEAGALAAWAGFANYLTPFVGGTGVRAVYLKRRHELPYASFVSVQTATYTLLFALSAVVGLGCLIVLPEIESTVRGGIGLALAAILVGCLVLYRWPFPVPGRQGRIHRFVRRTLEGWGEVRRADLTRLAALLSVNLLAHATSLTLAFAILGVSLRPVEALLIAALFSFSILLAITPAALGISEGIVVFAATALHLHAPTALAAAALRRLVSFSVTAIGAGLGYLGHWKGTD